MPVSNEMIREKLVSGLDAVLSDWDFSGAFMLYRQGELLYDKVHGFADRELGLATRPDSTYTLDSEDRFFAGLATLLLVDQGKLKFADNLAKFIPEYSHAAQISVLNVLKAQSGIPDFYYSKLMVALAEQPEHKALVDEQRLRVEKRVFYEHKNIGSALNLIGDAPLEYKPGTPDLGSSESDWVFLAELVRRVSSLSLFDFLRRNLFEPLGMAGVRQDGSGSTVSYCVFRETQLVRMPCDFAYDGLMTVTIDDMKKLLLALAERRVFSEGLWRRILKLDAEGNGILIQNANGFDCSSAGFLGSGFHLYFNHASRLGFASLVNEEQRMKFEQDTWRYFRRDSRELIATVLTWPENTSMVPVNKGNLWDALKLQVADDQHDYVLDAKSSIAMGLLYGSKKVYVQMEGNLSVGLLVLDLQSKKQYFNIDIVLIDKRFQGRGYGKLMVRFAVETLKNAGAKELTIGVNRFNYAAQKIYMAAGFAPKSVYEEGMELFMRFED